MTLRILNINDNEIWGIKLPEIYDLVNKVQVMRAFVKILELYFILRASLKKHVLNKNSLRSDPI